MTEPTALSETGEPPVQEIAVQNESQQDSAPDGLPVSTPEPSLTAGDLIREARTAAGLHIAALAVAMKVPVRKLEALEANRWDDFADNTFVRALAASVCRHLKTDSKPILTLLPGGNTHILPLKSEGLNTPFHKPGDVVSLGETWKKIRVTVWAVLVLLVGAVVLFAMPQAWFNRPAKVVEVPLQVHEASKPESMLKPGEVMESVVSGSSATTTLAPAASTPVPQASAVVQSLPSAPMPAPVVVVAPPQTPASGALALAPVPSTAATGSEVLNIQAKADTWVDVQDKNGQVLLRRILKAGEKQAVSAKLPISVSIGNAEKTVVFVRGQAFNLSAVTRENVARFTVN